MNRIWSDTLIGIGSFRSKVKNLNAFISQQMKSINKCLKVTLGHDLILALQDN